MSTLEHIKLALILLKLEKIVDSELHADTAEEKAQKLRSFLKEDD